LVEEFNKNKSIKYVVPATINWFTISKGMIINRKEDLLNTLEQRDFHFMLSWFKNNNLEPSLDSFEKFKEQMQIDAKGRKIKNWDYFNYLRLEQNLSKLEKKQQQTQNQKTIRNKVIHQNTGSTHEEFAKQWEEERLKKEQTEEFEEPKMKM
ncbi:hypothetical protein, partial [Mesomycoplasma ovipneumoniae]|uniref:hypothetical protein n=1 Tax=Mesomycoplasma ovipneumoniae TaxID=29562 RepID=UPI002961F15A